MVALHPGHRPPKIWAQSWQVIWTNKPSTGRCMTWCKVQLAMDRLSYISHILWMLGKDLTSLGCNTYTVMPFIKTTDHQSYGPRCFSTSKPLNNSQGYVGSDMIYQWSWMGCHLFSHALLMYKNDLVSLECNPHTEMPSIQATDLPICGPRAEWILISKPQVIPREMWYVMWGTSDHR